jgi:hypothetical protein
VCARESSADHVCPTKLLWTRVRVSIVSTLRETTLADLLVNSAQPTLPALGETAGPALPTLGVQPLATESRPSTLTTGA